MRKLYFISAMILLSLVTWGCSQNNNQTAGEEGSQEEKMVKISTEHGDIVLKLFNETPQHRDNFLKLAEEGFYDGTLFHRIINGFMIQGGDPDSRNATSEQMVGSGGPGYQIPAEIQPGLIHAKGALAAARQGDQMNPERKSSGSQFYIVQGRVYTPEELDMMEEQMEQSLTLQQREAYTTVGGTPHLDNAYTVFGQVVEGLEVLDKLAATPTGMADRPIQDITMRVEVLK